MFFVCVCVYVCVSVCVCVCVCVSQTQEKLPVRGEPECLLELTGQDLIGLPIKAPHATFDTV